MVICENFTNYFNRINLNYECLLIIFSNFIYLTNINSNGGGISYNLNSGNLKILNCNFYHININLNYFGGGIYSIAYNNLINFCCFFNCTSDRGAGFRINPLENSFIIVNYCTGIYLNVRNQDVFDLWFGLHFINFLNSSNCLSIGDASSFQIFGSKDSIINFINSNNNTGISTISFWMPNNFNLSVNFINLIYNKASNILYFKYNWIIENLIFYKNIGEIVYIIDSTNIILKNCIIDQNYLITNFLTLINFTINTKPILYNFNMLNSGLCLKKKIYSNYFNYFSKKYIILIFNLIY